MNKFNFFLKVLAIFMCSTSCFHSARAQELFKLVTSASELKAGGKYIFASMANGDGYVMKSYASGNNCKALNATSTNGLVSTANGMAILTLESVGSGVWAFKDSSSQKYMTISSTKGNILQFNSKSTDKYSKFSISIATNNKATVSCTSKKDNQTYKVGFNSSSRLFSSYTSSNPLYLYKEYNPAKVVSLSISGNPQKTVYIAGDVPSAEGLKVTANYDDDTHEDVTGVVEWSFSPQSLDFSTSELAATATFKGISATNTFPIRVSTKCSSPLYMMSRSFVSADENQVVWNGNVFDIVLSKGTSGTGANTFLAVLDKYKETRAYKEQQLVITPKVNVYKVILTVFEHDTEFAVSSALTQNNIENASFAVLPDTDPNSDKRKYVALIPKDESKPIVITLAGKLALETVASYYRPLTSAIGQAGYATLSLPYAAKVPEGMKAFGAKDDGQKVTLIERGDGMVAANEGVVLQGKAGAYEFFAADGEVMRIDTNEMEGVVKDTLLTSHDNAYLLTRRKSDGKVAFRLLQTDYTLGANKAFLKSRVQNPGRVLLSVYDAVETGIDAMDEDADGDVATEKGKIYNLSGQRMSRVQKGINIVDGRLVIR